jgi:hypothetical protein
MKPKTNQSSEITRRNAMKGIVGAASTVVLGTGVVLPTAFAPEAAAQAAPMPNMPARNPWLMESAYPMTHINPAQTISVLFAGPTKGRNLSSSDVKTIPTVFTSDPTVKIVGGERIVFASGINGIKKIIATGESFKEHSFLPYPGFEAMAAKATPEAIGVALAEANAASYRTIWHAARIQPGLKRPPS